MAWCLGFSVWFRGREVKLQSESAIVRSKSFPAGQEPRGAEAQGRRRYWSLGLRAQEAPVRSRDWQAKLQEELNLNPKP